MQNANRIGVDRSNDQTRYEHLKPTLEPLEVHTRQQKYCHEETDMENILDENISYSTVRGILVRFELPINALLHPVELPKKPASCG